MDTYQSIPQPQYPTGGSKLTSVNTSARGEGNQGNGLMHGQVNMRTAVAPNTTQNVFIKDINSELNMSNG